MSNMWLKSCFQDLVIDAFGFRDTPLAEECPDCLNPEAGGLGGIIPFLTARYPDARMALTSTTADRTIRGFYGYGYYRTCDFPGVMPPADFEAGLVEIRDVLTPGDTAFRTYIVEDDFHTLTSHRLDDPRTGGGLGAWLTQQVTDDPAWTDVWVPAPAP